MPNNNLPPGYIEEEEEGCSHLMDNFELDFETGQMECRICKDRDSQEPADFSGASDELGFAPDR